jgi:hypothetical protein
MLDASWTNSGVLGQASRFIEGSAAGELESVYETMRGVFSLDSIAKLKEASPTVIESSEGDTKCFHLGNWFPYYK